jgi:hypothetical protein
MAQVVHQPVGASVIVGNRGDCKSVPLVVQSEGQQITDILARDLGGPVKMDYANLCMLTPRKSVA